MTDRENKRRCQGTITIDKRGNEGQPCKLWAQRGSPYCNRHQGGRGAGTPKNPDAQHRCIARSHQSGEQCRNSAMRGQRVCKYHGGATKASRAKAQDLLDRMVEPVLHELRDIALNPDSDERTKLRAIQMVLDRTLPKEAKVEVDVKPWEITMQHIFQGSELTLTREPSPQQIAELEAQAPTTSYDDMARYLDVDDIEDAEVVEDDNPRDYLPQIRPASGAHERATYVPPRRQIGSAEPPQRRTEDED